MKVIGLAGQKGVGKNYVANIIRELQCSFYYEVAFADPIKYYAIDILGIPDTLCFGSDDDKNEKTKYDWERMPAYIRGEKSGQMTAREILQVLGTELGRNLWGKDVWTNALAIRVSEIRKMGAEVVVVTDVRFQNEADCVRNIGGEVWLVDGPRRSLSLTNDLHLSESSVLGILPDRVIRNFPPNDSKETLKGVILAALESMK